MQEETQKAESDVDIGEPEVLAPRVLTYQSLGGKPTLILTWDRCSTSTAPAKGA